MMKGERNIYPADLAKQIKESGGGKYQPSNGSEGDIFQELWCEKCVHDNAFGEPRGGCEILTKTMFIRVDDPDYPPEWNYDSEGQPQCTAFGAIPLTELKPPLIVKDPLEVHLGERADARGSLSPEQWAVDEIAALRTLVAELEYTIETCDRGELLHLQAKFWDKAEKAEAEVAGLREVLAIALNRLRSGQYGKGEQIIQDALTADQKPVNQKKPDK